VEREALNTRLNCLPKDHGSDHDREYQEVQFRIAHQIDHRHHLQALSLHGNALQRRDGCSTQAFVPALPLQQSLARRRDVRTVLLGRGKSGNDEAQQAHHDRAPEGRHDLSVLENKRRDQ